MKLLKILIVLALFAIMPASCVGQAKLFKEAAALDGVTSIYVGKAMVKLGLSALKNSGDKDAANVFKYVRKINSLELLTCESAASTKKFGEIVDRVIGTQNMELLTEVHENGKDGSDIAIYGRVDDEKDDGMIDGMIMKVKSDDEAVVIHVSGKIDINGLIESYAKGDSTAVAPDK